MLIGGNALLSTAGEMRDCYNYPTPTGGVLMSWTMLDTSIASLESSYGTTAQASGLSVGQTTVRGSWQYIEWWDDFDGSGTCQPTEYTNNSDAPVEVRPRIDSISPERGLVGSSVEVTIRGSGFGSGATVSAGSNISVTVDYAEANEIGATFNIASNAPGGNHAVTVTFRGQQSNSVNFFVQIPTRLRRDRTDSLVDIDPGPGNLVNAFGETVATNRCGAYRNVVYTLVDQQGQPILMDVEITEVLSNYQGPPGLQLIPKMQFTREGVLGDIIALVGAHPECPPSSFSLSLNQGFFAMVGQQRYDLTTLNSIAISKDGSGNWTITITPQTP